MGFRGFLKTLGATAEKNAPTILMAVGIGGSITALVLAIQETPKAMRLLDEAQKQKDQHAEDQDEIPEKLTLKEELCIFGKTYWPALLTEAGAITCFLIANKIHIRRGAALAALYKASEETFRLYQDKTRERIGEKEEHEIHRAVNQEKMQAASEKIDRIVETGRGNQLFYDPWSDRIFRASLEDICHAQNSFNKRLLNEGDLCLNDWYDEINLPDTDAGYQLGWNCDCLADQVELIYEAHLLEDKTAVTAVQFAVKPDYDFRVSHYSR